MYGSSFRDILGRDANLPGRACPCVRILANLINCDKSSQRAEGALEDINTACSFLSGITYVLQIPLNDPRTVFSDSDVNSFGRHYSSSLKAFCNRLPAPCAAATPTKTAFSTKPDGACADQPSFSRPIYERLFVIWIAEPLLYLAISV